MNNYLKIKFGEGEIKEFEIGKGIEWETDNLTINCIFVCNDYEEIKGSYVNFFHNELFAAKEEYRKKIESVLGNPQHKDAFGQQARVYVKSNYSWSLIAKKYLDVLVSLDTVP